MAMQSPDIPFTLWIHKSKMDGQDEFVTQIKHREDGGLDFNMPNFTAFKHRLETGPIQYNEKTDELWYVDPETHAEVHIVDQQSLEIGIRKALGEGRLGLAVNVAKKQVSDEVYKEAVEKWLDDQAEVERLRESDPKKYEKTYF